MNSAYIPHPFAPHTGFRSAPTLNDSLPCSANDDYNNGCDARHTTMRQYQHPIAPECGSVSSGLPLPHSGSTHQPYAHSTPTKEKEPPHDHNRPW